VLVGLARAGQEAGAQEDRGLDGAAGEDACRLPEGGGVAVQLGQPDPKAGWHSRKGCPPFT
jgi:hypothetical protein